ncbi:unnamed protein product [Ceutorhynchus assimilis]|uniref:5'-nucleotidase n=1 Tax=Ceutorhynchus assimilis TaxID=467358 RepID=A0A9N9N3R2_9CUCU|nr:unnamed protein product [Ceutorhynchus assimilis]
MMHEIVIFLVALLGCCSSSPNKRANDFDLVILHNNDMHGRFEETERNTGTCQPDHRNKSCIGGMARTAHVIRAYRERHQKGTGPPVLYLNAGDTFVGTAWFSVFTWNISSTFLNALKPDAVSLGNHEFDLTSSVLSEFVDHLDSPILAANLNFSLEPNLVGKFNASTILHVDGRRIGIIGYLTPETIKISSTGSVVFENEIIAVKREADSLRLLGVNIIIALGHSGYQMDQAIAKEVELVDLVIGGHTNTFLYNGNRPDSEIIEDPYPKVITQKSGKRVPVVQAFAYTKYLGVLNCTFNTNGDLIKFAGQPLLMETSIPQEQDILELLHIYRPAIDNLNKEVIGYSRVYLDGESSNCRFKECNLGNLVTDALVSYAITESTQSWTNVPIGLYNGGGLRNSINPVGDLGKITRGDLMAVLPFGNQVFILTLKGSDLIEALEQMVRSTGETSMGEFPQVSGLKLELDMTKKPYSRIVSVKARCGICEIPKYYLIDPEQNYTLVTSSFLANGGDGITVLKEKPLERREMDGGDLDAVANFITRHSPIYPEIQGRIKFVNGKSSGTKISSTWLLISLSLLMIFVRKYIV